MANHKSALKRIRQNESRKVRNRYYAKTMRNAVKKFRLVTDKNEAGEQLPKLYSMIDKLAKKEIIHKNKAGNLKSKITKHYNSVLSE
jgi:small subunit ribosomal protein S20